MAQHTQSSFESVIFITHVEADDIYLKIWGQLDKQAATSVEHYIYPLIEQFNQGYGRPSKLNRLAIGTFCCARFQSDGYYRAKILGTRTDGMIVVQFIDYGNVEVLPLNEIRLWDNIREMEPLRAFPPMAYEFSLMNVLPINGIWDKGVIEEIKKILCYNEFRAFFHMMSNRCFVKLWYNNEDFSELLVKQQLALSTTLPTTAPAIIPDLFRPKHVLQPHLLAYQQQNKSNMNNCATMPIMQNPNMNHNSNVQGFHKMFSTDTNQHKHDQRPSQPPPVQEALVFKSRVLDVNSQYQVLISHVEDGPQKFSVQVESTQAILTQLMDKINSHPKQPLQEPPLPGSVCLGRYRETAEDGVLCRAVVMSVMEHKCKLYYVDFGHTEVLPYTDIFQLPPEYINPKVLSIRFTLSGLRELNITQEMKAYFKELVYRKLLILHVRPPEGPPLIQYGDLYDNGVNIKDMLKKAFPAPAVTIPITYSYPQLQRLSKDVQEVVHVSYVESCKKFFVQLDSGIKSLDSIMTGLAQYAKMASVLNTTQLKAGLPCAALYDSQWYRAQILSVTGDKVKVVYVDYGNEEVLPTVSLRTIHDDLVTNLPAQAIKCALNGYEVLSLDQEVSNHFERLTLEKRFYMKVVAAQPKGLLVDLFEFDTMRSIHPQLLNNLFCDKNSTSTPNGEIQHPTKPINNFQSGSKDRYNKKSNVDTWNRNQNTKPYQDNKPNSWREERSQQYDNRHDRTGAYSHDGLQNDRSIKNEIAHNRFGRDKSYHKHDKNEINTFNRSSRETSRNSGNKFNDNERRYNRNNSDKVCSDKDSDTSSKGSGKRAKCFNRDGFNNGREESYDSGISNKSQTGKWSDRKPSMARKPSYKNGKFTGDYNSNEKFKDKENNTNNVLHDQINTYESWDTGNVNKKLENNIVVNRESQFSPINVTLGSIKNCEVVFINSPLDFFVQLNPDCLELDTIMENIAATYENNGKTMEVSEIQCGTCCIAQYSEDLKWYRVVIKSVEENSATVEFVDYGNTESVDFTKIKIIQEKFLKLPMQAVRCKLLGLTSDKENEHTIFSENVEGKLLEVEFVAEKNGVYEVLLREIINDIPNIKYINEEFCTMQDLTKAKETMAIEKTFKATMENIQESPDYAPIDSKWQATFYESGSEYDAIVTWFINPNKLYCQLLAKETEFKAIMSEIQKIYTNRKPVTDKLQIGSAVIAMFAEDRALYRAEVINTSVQKDTYVVQYIDFGNCAIVNLHNIYPVEKKFMQLPKLAIQCSLKNIVPNNNSDWSKTDNNALDNCFNADKYKCIFHDFSNNQYTISLIHNGQDVGDMLVQKNLAAFVTKTSVETICSKALGTSDTEIKMLNDVERVDISLLSGQILKMKVSNVESVTLFHVQLLSASKYEKIIHNYMADKNTEVMPRLSTGELCLDAGCLINVNGTWKRAVVINCSRSKEFYVKLIDTGMCQKIMDGALALPGELAIMQNQALECSLQNVTASSDADKRLKEFVGKEILVMVEEVNNNRLIVKLYDLLGNGIMNTEEKVEKILPICLMPILSSTHLVFVSYLENPTNIWLQRYSEMEHEAKLLKDLEEYYCNSGQKLKKPEINLLCAAKCLEDGNWYRGKIISYTETTACVHYIDYGNTEEIALESIMILEPQFYEPHQLAINVSLSITLSGTEDEQLNLLQTHLMNKEFTAVFYNVHKKWIVDLIENEEKLSDKFRSLNLVLEEQTPEQTPDSQTHETPTVNKFNVYVSHVDSPSQFWLQRVDELTSLNEKQEQLQLEVSNFPTINGILEEGTLCVATYSIDNLWYRAEVLDGDEDITTVRFIDYGNTDVVNNKAAYIRQIPDAWKSLERFALKCRLDVIPIDMEDWDESTCETFENLVTSETAETVQALIIADTVPKRVELFINDKSVSEMLVEEKLAIMINTEQEPVDEIVDLELDPHSAFVCHINSPNEFWVQEEKSVADLEVMADRFIVADMFPKIDDVKEDLLCVAKYPDDEQWYRARVISHDNGNTQVIYIDYGNSAVSTEIRAIPEDLAIIPPLSRKCCLQLPPQIKEWSEQACEEFFKLAADGATIFLLDVLKEQEVSLVKLTLDGQNVADILASMCEQHLPVIEERLPPLGEENSPNVVVSHINSPNEFWIQAESSISELEVMSDRLRDAESFLALNNLDIGTICAARYPEDGYWYRAKIIAHCETGTEVLYMDYGNSAVTEELRILPEDIVNIPILSKRCTLEKPSHIATWSEEACDKFKELAAEGATMFQFENLDEDDPMHVRLNLNGTSVVDLLLATFENIPAVIGEITEKSPEEEIISITKGKQAIVQEAHELVNNSEETSNLDQEAQKEQTSNQIDNLDCINQVVKTEKNENGTDEEVFNKSFINSDINEGNECNEEQQKSKSLDEIEEKKNEKSEITVVECTSKVGEISEDIVETNKDVDIATNEAVTSTISCFKESLHVMELSVDEIVGSMLRDTIDDIESRIDHTNLSITNEMQLPDIAQIAEQQELLSQTQSIDINNSSDTNTDIQILKVHETRDDDSEAMDKIPKILPITNESQFQDVMQLNNNQVKEQKVHVELQLGANEPSNDFQILKTISLQKKKENLEQRQESPTKSETIPESIDNNNDLEIQSKNVDTDNDFNTSSKSTCTIKTAQTMPCVIKTDSAEQHNYSRRRSEDETIPECVSKDESPSGSEKRPVTPKTPHSEKLVAGAVNPFVQSIPDNMNEEDEILTVSVENNIPKYTT